MDKPLFELTNHQRACFGLAPVESHWELIRLNAADYVREEFNFSPETGSVPRDKPSPKNFFDRFKKK